MRLSKSGITVDLHKRLISALEPQYIHITYDTNNYVENSVNATEYNDFKRYIITERNKLKVIVEYKSAFEEQHTLHKYN